MSLYKYWNELRVLLVLLVQEASAELEKVSEELETLAKCLNTDSW
jgi:hypothetical protein